MAQGEAWWMIGELLRQGLFVSEFAPLTGRDPERLALIWLSHA